VSGPRKLAIFDRDGTIIDFVRDEESGLTTTAFHPSHLRLLDGAVTGMLTLARAGYTLAIATNQPGPAKGHFSPDAVTRTHTALVAKLGDLGITIARVEVCMHHPDGGDGSVPELVRPCDCRKPKPGMLLSAMSELEIAAARTWMIGDSQGDVEAGRAAGVRTALLLPTRCELCPHKGNAPGPAPDVTGRKLDDVAYAIIKADGSR
jgi:D-glycero-D-manno-heptose 1,7-bisphosphate phosphatase